MVGPARRPPRPEKVRNQPRRATRRDHARQAASVGMPRSSRVPVIPAKADCLGRIANVNTAGGPKGERQGGREPIQ